MTSADQAVEHLLNRIKHDPQLAYHFDPLSRSMELLTQAYADANHHDVITFRAEFYRQLRFERPTVC